MKPFRLLTQFFKSLFLHGFFTIFPITATIVIVHLGYTVAARWIAPIRQLVPENLRYIPGSELILVTLFILLIGALLRFFILSPVVHHIEHLIDKIPLVRIIYSSSKVLVDFFNVPNPATVEKQVVLVPFPHKSCYNIAFLLDDADDSFGRLLPPNASSDSVPEGYYKVFMPNSPNPTTGYFFILPKSEVIHTTMTFEDAIKTIVSCGIHNPQSLTR